MKSASEALQETKMHDQYMAADQMAHIELNIDSCIDEGETRYYTQLNLSPVVVKKLRNLGYVVELNGRDGQHSTSISWAD